MALGTQSVYPKSRSKVKVLGFPIRPPSTHPLLPRDGPMYNACDFQIARPPTDEETTIA